MITLFPTGFEEVEDRGGVELAAYTDAQGEERLWHTFGGARATDVDDGWEERWRTFHRPVRVGELWIGPPWETPPPDAMAVVIDPGRAFGTGGHPTTRLCLELLARVPRGSLLDVGCGSGVLAIAGARLGFAPVTALDVETQAVEATRTNAAANGVEVDARLGDAFAAPLPASDVAVANITPEAVAALGALLRSARVVTSGYLVSDAPALPGYRRTGRVDSDGWAADLHERE
jgi:ribosomal protein L11 methyltransferase